MVEQGFRHGILCRLARAVCHLRARLMVRKRAFVFPKEHVRVHSLWCEHVLGDSTRKREVLCEMRQARQSPARVQCLLEPFAPLVLHQQGMRAAATWVLSSQSVRWSLVSHRTCPAEMRQAPNPKP